MKLKRLLICSLIGLTAIILVALSYIVNDSEAGADIVSIAADTFSLENDKGETLNFSFGEITGNMNIEQSTQFQEGTSTTFVLPYSKEYIFYSDQHNTGVAIEAEDRAQSFEGTGIECARFIENNGISLEGKNISATVSINYPEGEKYAPFRLFACSDDSLSVNTTGTGIEVHGISALIPLRASYHPAANPDIQFDEIALGSFSGSIFIDLSKLESDGCLTVITEDGSHKIIDLD